MNGVKLPDKFGNIQYFVSLVLEDYFGDKDELMEMAGIDENDIETFYNIGK